MDPVTDKAFSITIFNVLAQIKLAFYDFKYLQN